MSVHRRPSRGGWVVRYREGTTQRSRGFDKRADAVAFETEVRRRRQLGGLEYLNAGTETLGEYVEGTWAETHLAQLAPRTRKGYACVFDKHIDPFIGDVPLRSITPETVSAWQARLLREGRSADTVRRSATLLGSILQRATEGRRIMSNPQRSVKRPRKTIVDEVRPLAPAKIELLRLAVLTLARKGNVGDRTLRHRDAVLISLLAYAGLRPQEARGLVWRQVRENTLLVDAPKTGQRRTVRLLAPLRQDLAEWRLASGRPDDDVPIIPAQDGGPWSEIAYRLWRSGIWAQTLEAAGVAYQRPYDLRHSFASLLLHEGRSVIYVARQLGHGAGLTMGTYGHVIDELEESPNLDAESAIREARASAMFPVCSPGAVRVSASVGSAS